MFTALLLVVIRKETYALMLFEGSKPLRVIVTELNEPPHSFQLFSARAEKKFILLKT